MASNTTWSIRVAIAIAFSASAHCSSLAQDPASADAGIVVVTGSRIARLDADGVSPMRTLSRDDIKFAAPTSVGDLLQSLPNAGASLNSNGTQGTAFGASAINLRYLGSAEGSGNRTLVLVDGHRWVNAAGGRGFRDFVDLNTIPLGIIDRIEILKDGASAIYGADAIAGVINIHTRRRFVGLETKLQAGESSRGDGRNLNGFINWGRRSGVSELFVSASFNDSKPIGTADRELTRAALMPLTAAPSSPRGLYVLPGLAGNSYFGTSPGFGQNGANAITRSQGNGAIGAGALADDSFHVARLPGDYYNTQVQGLYASGPSRRAALFARLGHQLGDLANMRFELLHTRRESSQLFAPVPLDLRGASGFALSRDQVHNPFGTANGVPLEHALGFSGNAFRLQRVPIELGNRRNLQSVDTSRAMLALDGRIQWLGEWRWDASYSYSRNRARFEAINQVNLENVHRALAAPAVCAAAPSCVPLNVFGTITPAMADYIRYNARDDNGTGQTDFTFNATRTLGDLEGGPIGLAAGYEFRREAAFDRPDAFAAAGSTVLPLVDGLLQSPTTAQGRDATHGSYRLGEAYLELSAPLLANRPGAHALTIDAAVRYSRYSTVGGKATGKIGVLYKPVETMLLRGTWSQGFRAPSILELYQGKRQTNFPAVDPCNGGGAGQPGCNGVPNTYHQGQFNSGLIAGVTAGNRNLRPDSADIFSIGAGYSTRNQASAYSFTVDKFRIKIRDAIAAQSATSILQSCARSGTFCSLVQRGANGEVVQLTQAVVNLAQIEVEGIDATMHYVFPARGAKIDAAIDGAYLQRYRSSIPQPGGGIAIDDRAGKSDQPRSSFPRVKAQASLRYVESRFHMGWKARYIGGSDDLPSNPVNGGRVASVWYQDLQGHYALTAALQLSLGVDNFLDTQPPASAANNPINFDIYTYDVRGRYFYARLSAKF